MSTINDTGDLEKHTTQAPKSKPQYIAYIGGILVKKYGKKAQYSPEEVEHAHEFGNRYGEKDFSYWGMSVFCSHNDFDSYSERTGIEGDYTAMKSMMLIDYGGSRHEGWTESSWLDILDVGLDSSGATDGFFDVLGEIFGGFLDL